MKECQACGEESEDRMRFCGMCGARLVDQGLVVVSPYFLEGEGDGQGDGQGEGEGGAASEAHNNTRARGRTRKRKRASPPPPSPPPPPPPSSPGHERQSVCMVCGDPGDAKVHPRVGRFVALHAPHLVQAAVEGGEGGNDGAGQQRGVCFACYREHLVSVTQAQRELLVTKADIARVASVQVPNPLNKGYLPMRLFLRSDVRAVAVGKFGSDDALQQALAAKEARKRARQERQDQRRAEAAANARDTRAQHIS